MRRWALFLFAVLPGFCAVGVCGYYLFQDWSALISAFARFERLVNAGADLRQLFIAQSLDQVYRINCFADGVGVMLGAVILAIGVHGLCVAPPSEERSARRAVAELAGAATVSMAALLLFAGLIVRVGQTNALRRAVIRGDAPGVEAALAGGARGEDSLWWGQSAVQVAGKEAPPAVRAQILKRLQSAQRGKG